MLLLKVSIYQAEHFTSNVFILLQEVWYEKLRENGVFLRDYDIFQNLYMYSVNRNKIDQSVYKSSIVLVTNI